MWSHAHTVVFFHTQSDISVDSFISEHAARSQELAVFVQAVQCFFQRASNLWDLFRFFWRQVVQVFVHCFARMDFVLDTIKTSHQQCCEAQVRVSCWVREAHFDTTCFRRRNYWDTD
ncbi:hypothetical protein D3C75_1141460 [compost metagenome]